jgi:hypothetical protein
MDDAQADRAAFDTAERLLGAPLVLLPGTGASGAGQVLRREATALRVWVSPASGWSRRTGGKPVHASRSYPSRRERARRHSMSR